MSSIKISADRLIGYLPELESRRDTDPLANDVYEAACYWRELCGLVQAGDTRVDYPARATEELGHLEQLRASASTQPRNDRDLLDSVFAVAREALLLVRAVRPPRDGHLGILKIIKDQFRFLETQYAFATTDEHPTGIKYSSGVVYLGLEYSHRADLSCTFGLETKGEESYSLETLLFLLRDERYRDIADWPPLNSASALDAWFRFVASVWRQHGHDVLTNQGAIFERLRHARAERDEEYDREMRRLHGQSGGAGIRS